MPEELFNKVKLNIKWEWKLAFLSAFIIGFFTHLFIFTNALPNHDGINNYYDPQTKLSSGRFFLSFFAGITSYFDLPLINGVIGTFYLSIMSIVTIELFKIRKLISIILISGIIVTFPTIASTFSYMFTADGYLLSFLTTVLAVLLTVRYKYGFLIASILLYLSIGVYQANLALAFSYLTLFITKEMIFTEKTLKSHLILISKLGGMVILALLAYVVTFKLFQSKDIITGYQGLDKAGTLNLNEIPGQLSLILKDFNNFFFTSNFNLFEYLNIGLFTLIIIGSILVITVRFKEIKFTNILIAVLGLSILPVVSLLLHFISLDIYYHMLMVMSLSVFYFIPVLIYDSLNSSELKNILYSWSTVLLTTIIIFNFMLISNISYSNINMKYEKTYALTNRVVDRIEQMSEIDSTNPKKIAVIGSPKDYIDSPTASELSESVPIMTGALGNVFVLDSKRFSNMTDQYFGVNLDIVSVAELDELKENKQVKNMEVWPSSESVSYINNTIIIKFSDE